MYVSAGVGNLVWAGNVRRAVAGAGGGEGMGPPHRNFKCRQGTWPLSLGCREPWKDLEQERKHQSCPLENAFWPLYGGAGGDGGHLRQLASDEGSLSW